MQTITQARLDTALAHTNGVMKIKVLIPAAEIPEAREYLQGKHRAKALMLEADDVL